MMGQSTAQVQVHSTHSSRRRLDSSNTPRPMCGKAAACPPPIGDIGLLRYTLDDQHNPPVWWQQQLTTPVPASVEEVIWHPATAFLQQPSSTHQATA